MFDALLGRGLQFWLTNQARVFRSTSQPSGELHVQAMGGDSDRILLVLDRPSVGDGTMSQELGFAGHLARQVSALSGRGTDMDVIANGNMTAEETQKALLDVDLARFDSIILMIGSSEALSLVRPTRWRYRLGVLLDALDLRVPGRASILVVEIPPTRALIDFPPLLAVTVGTRINRLNAATRSVCVVREGVSVLPFDLPAARADGRNSSDVFRHWARFIAPIVRRELDRSAGRPFDDEPVDESVRQDALDRLHVIDDLPDPRVDRIVVAARQQFQASGAALTLQHNNRRWVKSATGTPADDSPWEGSLCERAIAQAGVFVIEDLSRSEHRRPAVNRASDTMFFAGFPIEAPDRKRVGVLSISDSQPRRFTSADESLLEELALKIQLELWGSHSINDAASP